MSDEQSFQAVTDFDHVSASDDKPNDKTGRNRIKKKRKTRRKNQNETVRRCIVTKEDRPCDELIRFVASPDGQIVPDLKQKLPGRGVWVEAKYDAIQAAAKKRLFFPALKIKPPKTDTGETATGLTELAKLAELVDDLLQRDALQLLALVKKAGYLVSGFTKVDRLIRSGNAGLVLHASDASADGIGKIASAMRFVTHMGGEAIKVYDFWPSERLSALIGQENVHHIGVQHGRNAKNCITVLERLANYRVNDQVNEN